MTVMTGPINNTSFTTFVRKNGSSIVSFLLFALGIFAVYKLLSTLDVHQVVEQLKAIPKPTLWMAGGATFIGYLALTGYDWSALRYLGKSVPTPVLVLGSMTAYAMSNTVGLAVLTGGAVRHRFYRGLGLDGADIAVIASFCALSFGMGVTLIGLAALVYHPAALEAVLPVSASTVRAVAALSVAVIVALTLWASKSQRAIKIGRFSLSLPKPGILGAQLAFSILDISMAALTLYLLLPSGITLPFATFLAVFAAAAVISVLSHVPGGIGVFESVIIAGVATTPDLIPGVTAALLAYRIIYYLIPFIISLVLLSASGPILRSSVLFKRTPQIDSMASVLKSLQPALITGLSALIFLVGAALILNGIVPIPAAVIREVSPLVHFGTFEISHAILGVVGATLIILSNGIRRRVKAALWMVLALMMVGITALLTQKIDYDMLILMILASALLYFSRDQFYRSSKITTQIMSFEWILLTGSLALTAVLLLFISHETDSYHHQMWWQFAMDNHLSRALRIFGAALFAGLLILLTMALRPAHKAPVRAPDFDAEAVTSIINNQDDPDAHFVFTGDKHVLMSENKDAFIMYAPQGRSLVALGDPIGNRAAWPKLIDSFIERADKHNYRPCFYQVGPYFLATYIDLGFSMSKLGEEAVVPLETFSLEGPGRKKLRAAYNRAVRDKLEFEMIKPPYSESIMDELSRVSDDWLNTKNAQEKSFSIGRFDEKYLQRSPLALIRYEGAIVAFANVLLTDKHTGSTLDLMRHLQNAPSGSMEFLFTSLMLHLKQEGYKEFSLGMVPLTGLSQSRNKRLWDHAGMAVARFGGHFYNFAGLRAYKSKFDPEWRPHYIATWGGMDPLLVAADVNALVSGGLLGAIYKPARNKSDA